MSSNIKLPWLQMRTVADAVVHKLQPACHRIEVAGSLRRMQELVGDIEIVAIPRMDIDLFGNPLDTSEVDWLLKTWPLKSHSCLSGVEWHKNGQKYKQFSFAGSSGYSYKIDLFLQPDPATWAVNFLLRTGNADFSHRMVTPKAFGGYKPDGYEVRDARVWRGGVAVDVLDEGDIFDLWGMKFIAPKDRV